MIHVFDRKIRSQFNDLLRWWFGCAILLGVAMPLLAAVALGMTAHFAGISASDLAWGFLSDVREPMIASVAGLHLFGALATFIAYGFVVEMSALLFSGGGAFIVALIAASASLIALASCVAILRSALGGDAARHAAFALKFPVFFPDRTGLLRGSNPAGAAPRLE